MDSLDPKGVLKFLEYVNELKHLPRRGWTAINIRNCETISGHMYAMALMSLLIDDDSGLDKLKCLQLSIVHDLAESILGDITPFDRIPEDQKHKAEDEAMKEITSHIGSAGQRIYDLYKEYAAKETVEAKFVKDLDRFDFFFTGACYEKRDKILDYLEDSKGAPNDIFEVFKSDTYKNLSIRKIADALEASRKNKYR